MARDMAKRVSECIKERKRWHDERLKKWSEGEEEVAEGTFGVKYTCRST